MIPTIELCNDNAAAILGALSSARCVRLKRAIHMETVQKAFDASRAAFARSELIERYPYDPEEDAGYTGPGGEGIGRIGPNHRRHFYNFLPESVFSGEPLIHDPLRVLYGSVLQRCEWVVSKLLKQLNTQLTYRHVETRRLRIAEYLNEGVDPSAILFEDHIDPSMLTWFIGGAKGGLQVKIGDTWLPVELGVGDVLVGTGSLLKQYCPALLPLHHRVIAGSPRRLSLFMYFAPAGNITLPSGETMKAFSERIQHSVRFPVST